MGEIRAFTEEHVSDVASLYLRAMRGRRGQRGSGNTALEDYFREIFFSNPWFSPDIPPLVYLDKSALVGFLGVVPRYMDFRGRRIRVAVISQFMIDRERYRGAAAIELLRYLFKGPQEMSFTDGAAEASHLVWTAAGGVGASLYSFNWMRVLRVARTVRGYTDRSAGLARLAAATCLSVAAPIDYLLSKLPFDALRPPQSTCITNLVDAAQLFQAIQDADRRDFLKAADDLPSFQWLLSQAAAARRSGDLRMATVHTPEGLPCGWFVYYAKPGREASLLQIGARRRDQFDAVLRALFRDAWEQGCSSVKGQAIPQYLVNLTNQYCLFRHANTSVLFQTRDPDLRDTVLGGRAALSRLDGECWLRFAIEDWS